MQVSLVLLALAATPTASPAPPPGAPSGPVHVAAAARDAGIYEQLRAKLVLGQNIAQAAQFAQSGNADIGVLAISLAKAPTLAKEGRYWVVPAEAYGPMEQTGTLITTARNPAAARAFIAFMQTSAARAILDRYGFVLPK